MHVDMAELARRKYIVGYQERNRLQMEKSNGAWISAVPHRHNGTELSWKEIRDNLCLGYGMIPQDIAATCDGFGKRLSIDHALSCSKGGLVLEWHDDSAKE